MSVRTETIPIKSIVTEDSPYYITPKCKREIDELVVSMKELGQLMPIVVITDGDTYKLAAGGLRILAAKKLGWDVIQARVFTKEEHEQAEERLGRMNFGNETPPTIHPQQIARVLTDIFLSLRPSHPASNESIKGIIELITLGQKIPGLNRSRIIFKLKNELVHDHGKHYFDNPSLSAKKILGSWYQGPMVVADELTRKIQASATQRYTAEQVLQIIHEIRTELTMDVSTGNYQPPEPKL